MAHTGNGNGQYGRIVRHDTAKGRSFAAPVTPNTNRHFQSEQRTAEERILSETEIDALPRVGSGCMAQDAEAAIRYGLMNADIGDLRAALRRRAQLEKFRSTKHLRGTRISYRSRSQHGLRLTDG